MYFIVFSDLLFSFKRLYETIRRITTTNITDMFFTATSTTLLLLMLLLFLFTTTSTTITFRHNPREDMLRSSINVIVFYT